MIFPATLARLLTQQRGGMTVLVAAMFGMMLAFGLLVVDVPYLYMRNLLLRQTAQAAALAAAEKLTSYYTSGNNSTAAIVSAAQTIATANMPSAQYGTVVPSSSVVVGTLSNGTFTSGGTSPNAVKVIGLNTAANGNAVSLFLGGMVGRPTEDLTATAVASFGTGQTFNTIIINDLSQSFSSDITNQRAADNAILNCVKTSAGSLSQFGITTFDGHSTTYEPLTQASTNLSAIQSKISALNSCGNSGAPSCSGSNVASAIYSAIQQFSGATYAHTKNNIIIITDGVPNANSSVTYTRADGIYPTLSSTTPTCPGTPNTCTDANLLRMATNQAANAGAAGISISTLYYSGNTPAGSQSSYASSLASLVTGTGVAMVAPTSSQISSEFAGYCATMSSALKLNM